MSRIFIKLISIMFLVSALFVILSCKKSIVYTVKKAAGYKPLLKLSSDKKFVLKVNLCQGVGTYKGKYTENSKRITLYINKTDFTGFLGAKAKTFTLEKISKNSFKFIGDVACSPKKNDIFSIK